MDESQLAYIVLRSYKRVPLLNPPAAAGFRRGVCGGTRREAVRVSLRAADEEMNIDSHEGGTDMEEGGWRRMDSEWFVLGAGLLARVLVTVMACQFLGGS
jgi:hypothetical protein